MGLSSLLLSSHVLAFLTLISAGARYTPVHEGLQVGFSLSPNLAFPAGAAISYQVSLEMSCPGSPVTCVMRRLKVSYYLAFVLLWPGISSKSSPPLSPQQLIFLLRILSWVWCFFYQR